MTKNLYYRTVFRRENVIKKFILDFSQAFASYPRLFLEVFIRKNFGERYFSLSTAITIAVIMGLFPWTAERIFDAFASSRFGYGDSEGGESGFWTRYATWYIAWLAFMYSAFLRWQEVKRNPSVFDFARFSLCTGDIHPFFYNLPVLKKDPDVRAVETFREPLVFFIAGVLLWIIGQPLGRLLAVSSVFYSLSYIWAYRNGDNFVMDRIDEMILNEEMEAAFVGDADAGKARGVRFYSDKPTSEDMRRKVGDTFLEYSPVEETTFAK